MALSLVSSSLPTMHHPLLHRSPSVVLRHSNSRVDHGCSLFPLHGRQRDVSGQQNWSRLNVRVLQAMTQRGSPEIVPLFPRMR